MNKFVKFLKVFSLAALVGTASASLSRAAYNAQLSSHTVFASGTTQQIDLNSADISILSVQVDFQKAALSAVTFGNGNASTASVTVASNTYLAGTTSYMGVTVASNTALAPQRAYVRISLSSSNATLDGAVISFYVGAATYTFTEGIDWDRQYLSQQSASMTAISIAQAINGAYGLIASTVNATIPLYISTGTANSPIVVVQAYAPGSYANAYSMGSSTQFALTVSYSSGLANAGLPVGVSTRTTPVNLRFGQDAAKLTLFTGTTFYLYAGTHWSVASTSSGTATNIARALNFSSYTVVTTTAGSAYYSFTSTDPRKALLRPPYIGTRGNLFHLRSSTQTALIVGPSTTAAIIANTTFQYFTYGRDAQYIKINGFKLTAGIDFTPGASAALTSRALSDAIRDRINLGSTTAAIVLSSHSASGVVFTTSTALNRNKISFLSSLQSALTLSNATTVYADGSSTGTMTGGYESNFDTTTITISTQNAFPIGTAVWVSFTIGSTGTTDTIGFLTSGVTYFVTNTVTSGLTSNSFGLANFSSAAVKGEAWTSGLSTANPRGGNWITLTPVNFSRAANVTSQISNDGVGWYSLNQSSLTISVGTLNGSTTMYNFGSVPHRYMRFQIEASSNSPVDVKIRANGK